MSFRITTNGMFRNYRTYLSQNSKNLNDAMTTVQTQRKFSSYADDPAAASQAFQLRRAYWRAGDQIDNSRYVINKFSGAWNAMDAIVDGTSEHPGLDGMRAALSALTDTSGSSRRILGVEMDSLSESLMHVMNTRYSDEFIFAGADGLNVPFSLNEEGRLLYRGIDVDSPALLSESEFDALDGDYSSLRGKTGLQSFEDWMAENSDRPKVLTEEEFNAALAKFPALTDRNGIVVDSGTGTAVNSQRKYLDYENWYANQFPKLSESDFNALTNKTSLTDKNGDPFTGSTYKEYEAWFDKSFPKLSKPEFDGLAGLRNKIGQLFGAGGADVDRSYEAYTEWAAKDYETDYELYQDWYRESYYPEGTPAKLSESELTDAQAELKNLTGADGKVFSGSTYAEYETWYGQQYGEKPAELSETEFNDLNGDYSTLDGFNKENPTYADYQTWYAGKYGSQPAKLTDAQFTAATDAAASLRNAKGEYFDGTTYGDYTEWYGDSFKSDFEKLELMNAEATYVDIGLGFQTDDEGRVLPASAFNSALSGIHFLGYGVDEDGDPKNIVSLMRDLGAIFRSCDVDTGTYPEEGMAERANQLVTKLHAAINRVQENHTSLDERVNYLQKNQQQLDVTKDNLDQQIVELEEAEPAGAILDMNWAQYCYNAALKVGTSLLTQSLIDYLR